MTATIVAQGAEIHPEVPMPAWATRRDGTDVDEGYIVDEHLWEVSGYRFEIQQLHKLDPVSGAWASSPPSIEVKYDLVWPDGTSPEQFCILPDEIPTLIRALQAAQAVSAA